MKEEVRELLNKLEKLDNAPILWINKKLYNYPKEIERLNGIIKEAIEYIQDRYDGEVLTHTFDKDNVKELLDILEGSDKND